MKTIIRAALLVLLAAAIVFGTAWYLLDYDTDFTHDALLYGARYFEERGQVGISTWLYDKAYQYGQSIEEIALELADFYRAEGNYAKVESTLQKAIFDGAGVDIYIALSKAFIEQDKLLDAMRLIDNVTDPTIRNKLELLRPATPTPDQGEGNYNEYISVNFTSEGSTVYVAYDQVPSVKGDHIHNAPIQLNSGKTTLYSMAISESGLVSPLIIQEYIVIGVVEPVVFADEKMEEAIRNIVSIPFGVTVYTNDLWEVRSFTVPKGAQNYSDLKHLPFLESLTLSNGVSTLAPIQALSNLTHLYIENATIDTQTLNAILALTEMKELTLRGCGIVSLSGFENLVNLTYLDLGKNILTDLTPISGMTALETLKIDSSAVVNLTALQGMTALKELDLSSNSIKTLSPLSKLTALQSLNLSNNQISSISALSKMNVLSHLNLSNNKITSVSSLSGCTSLLELNLSNNSLSSISAVANLVHLEQLDVSNNKISSLPSMPTNCALVSIDASYNKITNVSPLSGLKNLNTVNLDYNTGLSNVKSLAKCDTLVSLSVYGTKVKNVSELTELGKVVYYDPT